MRYKAIVFDLDGTAIPNREDGMPSQRLIDAVGRIRDKYRVCVATGRPISNSRQILRALGINSPCVISGGTQIINPKTEEVLWQKQLSKEQVSQIIDIARPYEYQLFFSDDGQSCMAKERANALPENIIYIMSIGKKDTPALLEKLMRIRDVSCHTVSSWTKGRQDIHITHKDATKKHAIELLLQMIHVNRDEIIGMGDSNNDIPIFEAVGYKVAVEDGSEDLKKLADEIAPSAEDDGVAKIIEKYFI